MHTLYHRVFCQVDNKITSKPTFKPDKLFSLSNAKNALRSQVFHGVNLNNGQQQNKTIFSKIDKVPGSEERFDVIFILHNESSIKSANKKVNS